MKIPNEVTVEFLVNFDESQILKKIKQLKEEALVLKNSKLVQHVKEELKSYQSFIDTFNYAKKIIKKHKLKSNQKIGLSFIPQFKKLTQDQMQVSKIGGVPFCFIRELNDYKLLDDYQKAYEHLKQVYPKNHQGTYLKFVGDLDTTFPTYFINNISVPFDYKKEKVNVFYHQDFLYNRPQKSMKGSLFIDEYSNSGSLTPEGAFYTNLYLDSYSPEKVLTYVKIISEFIKNEVDQESRLSVDNFKLTEIDSWVLNIEIPNAQNELEGNSVESSKKSNYMKLFGYAESQQRVYPYYCIDGTFGPRLLTPFLSINSKDDDNCIQIYGDLLQFNSSQEPMTHLKVVISGT